MKRIQQFLVDRMPQDKLIHFVAGFMIYNLSVLFLDDVPSFFVVIAFAILKEMRDQWKYKGADVGDYLFTIMPAMIMLIVNNLK